MLDKNLDKKDFIKNNVKMDEKVKGRLLELIDVLPSSMLPSGQLPLPQGRGL